MLALKPDVIVFVYVYMSTDIHSSGQTSSIRSTGVYLTKTVDQLQQQHIAPNTKVIPCLLQTIEYQIPTHTPTPNSKYQNLPKTSNH